RAELLVKGVVMIPRRFGFVLLLVASLAACSGSGWFGEDDKREVSEGLGSTIIGFYPKVPVIIYPQILSSLESIIKPPPENCMEKACGEPLLTIDDQYQVHQYRVVGSELPSFAFSPNGRQMILTDFYGVHWVNDGAVQSFASAPGTGGTRGLTIDNDGNFLVMLHLGGIEIEGERGFGSRFVYRQGDGFGSYERIIDGMYSTCGNNVYLSSYGDEFKDYAVQDPRYNNIIEYKYDWSTHQMNKIDRGDKFFSNHFWLYQCDEHDYSKFSYIGTDGESRNLVGYWDEASGYYGEHEFQSVDVRSANGTQVVSFYDDKIFYIDDSDIVRSIDKVSGATEDAWPVKDRFPELLIDMDNKPTYSIQDDSMFIFGRLATHTKQWVVGEFDLRTGATKVKKRVPVLDTAYPEIELMDARIVNVDGVRAWLNGLPDMPD
ncbi:hypothetical protein, partial [Stomatohabitans albus]|uniref:hypothetical protein n=2 Tax=Stomatohabitans albus TaxID=3110766 RepID=UPI00300D843D